MTHDETEQVFVHEFGHAVHYAICDVSRRDAESYKKTVTSIRDANIKRLTGTYWKASQYVPALTDLFTQHKYASCVSVCAMYDRMQKDKDAIPEAIFREFNYDLFSRYSLKSFNEYFCENFSAWITMTFPSEFARAIGKLAEKYAIRPDTEKEDSGINMYRQAGQQSGDMVSYELSGKRWYVGFE